MNRAVGSTSHIEVDPTNAGAFDAWNGSEGEHWAADADVFDACLARYREPFLDATRIAATDRVLDIGCGAGQSTLAAARLCPEGHVLGVDLSAQLLAVARRRATDQRAANVEFLHADAQIHPFDPASLDSAISHTGAMFFGDAPTAFANIARALRAGAALTLLVWQKPEANDWFLELTHIVAAGRDLPPPRRHEAGPFSLADPDHTRSLLEANGFARVGAEGLHEPMWFGSTPDEALRFSTRLGILAARLRELEPLAREDALGRLRESISAHQTAEGVRYPSAMWLITASRR